MESKLEITVTCGECNESMPSEVAGQADEMRCQECGSLKKKIHMRIEEAVGIDIRDTLRGKVRDPNLPSKKNPRVDFLVGTDLRKSDGKWMEKERVIDRDENLYKEAVVDPENGQEIHRNEEPPSDHFGHGSAKFKNTPATD